VSGLTVVGRSWSPIFTVRKSEVSPFVSSTAWVFSRTEEARKAFHSVEGDGFGSCLRDGLRASFTHGHQEVTRASAKGLKFELVMPLARTDGTRAYAAELEVKNTRGGPEYTVHMDLIAVRLGRTVAVHTFSYSDARTSDVTWVEESSVADAVGRVTGNELYRSLLARVDASFGVSGEPYRAGAPVRLVARKRGQVPYVWDFGDWRVDIGEKATVTHRYRKAGRYVIELSVGGEPSAQSRRVLEILPRPGK
jgi:hypothetical protein